MLYKDSNHNHTLVQKTYDHVYKLGSATCFIYEGY